MRTRLSAMVCVLALFVTPPARAYQMADSLKAGDQHAGNPVGGQYTAEGWQVTAMQDRMWFEIPTLPEGAIEFTVKGINVDNLVVDDNEIFAMYEAGFGMTEPLAYSPYYRSNDYKCMVRIYGSVEPDRVGMQKFMWGICQGGSPGYHDACPCASSVFEEPFGGDQNWDGSPQVLRVEWGGGHARFLRNGGVVHDVDYSGSGVVFAPETPHFSLGSPRLAAVSTSSMPIGAIFYDLKVTGVAGAAATCFEPADAGITDAGGGADGGGQPGQTAVIEDSAVHRYEPDTNPPDQTSLDCGGDAQGAYDEAYYLKFDVQPPAGERVDSARVWVYCGSLSTPASASGGGGEIRAVVDNGWHETTITWNNKPAWGAQALSSLGRVTTDTWYSFDVTAAVNAPGVYSFAVISTDPDTAHFLSKEGGAAGGRQPYMTFTSIPVTGTDGGVQDSGGRDSGVADDAATPPDAGVVTDAGATIDGGGEGGDAGREGDAGAPGQKDAGAPMDGGAKGADAGASDYGLGCGCHTMSL